MLVCPRCDGQGSIVKAEIKYINKLIFICDECEAIWFSRDAIFLQAWEDFGTYMENNNLSPTWDELRVLGDEFS